MVKFEIGKNTIYGINKISRFDGKSYLDWKSSGLSYFFVLRSSVRESLLISKNKEEYGKLIAERFKQLLNEKVFIEIKNGLYCKIVTLDDLKRNGGMQIQNQPFSFAIYGMKYNENNEIIICIDENNYESNFFSMTVDISIKDQPFFIEKRGFLKAKSVYSGFHKITLENACSELCSGALKYYVNNHSYSFPDGIVKNGGFFFVKADENYQINFESSIKGIIIK